MLINVIFPWDIIKFFILKMISAALFPLRKCCLLVRTIVKLITIIDTANCNKMEWDNKLYNI